MSDTSAPGKKQKSIVDFFSASAAKAFKKLPEENVATNADSSETIKILQ